MAYQADKKAIFVLSHPIVSGLIIIIIGVLGGVYAAQLFGPNMFERFGSLTVALGVLIFGCVVTELQVRGQSSLITADNGLPPSPFTPPEVRLALFVQTLVVCIGTIQWGFGSLAIDGIIPS
ncbi:MAG: hypothetical protein AAF214_01160 [Pseudomonadota bacterium]